MGLHSLSGTEGLPPSPTPSTRSLPHSFFQETPRVRHDVVNFYKRIQQHQNTHHVQTDRSTGGSRVFRHRKLLMGSAWTSSLSWHTLAFSSPRLCTRVFRRHPGAPSLPGRHSHQIRQSHGQQHNPAWVLLYTEVSF